MLTIEIIGGNIEEGRWIIEGNKLLKNNQEIELFNNIETLEILTEEKIKKLANTAGWAFLGGIVGGLLTGGIGAIAGLLAGGLAKGNATKFLLAIELKDKTKMIATAEAKAYQKLVSISYKKRKISGVNDVKERIISFIPKEQRKAKWLFESIYNVSKISEYICNQFVEDEEIIGFKQVRNQGKIYSLIVSNYNIYLINNEERKIYPIDEETYIDSYNDGIIFKKDNRQLKLYYNNLDIDKENKFKQELEKYFGDIISIKQYLPLDKAEQKARQDDTLGIVCFYLTLVVIIVILIKIFS